MILFHIFRPKKKAAKGQDICVFFLLFDHNLCHLSFSSIRHASLYLVNGTNRIGNVYKKAMYIEYTDGTFTTEKPKLKWLGFLGPVIRAEVGDDIVVHMKNFANRSYSIHPHGVLYKKDSEGRTDFIVLLEISCMQFSQLLSCENMNLKTCEK